MQRRTNSLDCLYFESSKIDRLNEQQLISVYRWKSLENIHLNVNTCWFFKNRLTRSKSSNLAINHVNHVNNHQSNRPNLSFKQMNSNCKLRISTKLIDDHNLPSSISEDFFNELMKYEKNRLRTFKNWPIDFITPEELSKAGFYYLLETDHVRCFECKITLFNWEIDDRAIIEHYRKSVKCRLLNGYDVGNVSIDRTPLDLLKECLNFQEFKAIQSEENVIFEFDNLDIDDEDQEILDRNALNFDHNLDRSSELFNAGQQQSSFNEQQLYELMKSEEKRLKTFDTWPQNLIDKVKPVDLAQCGFFFTTIKDKVICAFCRTPAWDWNETDIPIKEHYRHSCECPLLNDEDCGNQPIKNVKFKELLMEYQDIAPSYSTSYSDDDLNFLQFNNHSDPIDLPHQDRLTDSNETQYPICTHKYVDKYYTYDNRVQTFDDWSNKSVKKDRLAKAGFYFTGFNDTVKCFSCDLVLSKWSVDDDPWIEHCKWNGRNCEFLKLEKGHDFIARHSQLKNSPKIQVTCGSTASSNSSSDIENEASINLDDVKNVCKICMVKEANIVFLPCSHLVSCASCTIPMKSCPLCKRLITSTMKIFIS